MAIGTITIVSRTPLAQGGQIIKCSFAGDGDYHTNGTPGAEVETALELAIKTAAGIASDANVRGASNVTIVELIPGEAGQYTPSWTGGKLKVRDSGHATWDEVANHGNLAAVTFNLSFICK